MPSRAGLRRCPERAHGRGGIGRAEHRRARHERVGAGRHQARDVGGVDAPVQVHGNAKAEIGWTILPALILAVVGVFTVVTVFDINKKADGAEARV